MICQLECSSMRKNHKLSSHRNTRNIIKIMKNIRKAVVEVLQEVTPSNLGTNILKEGTNVSSRARMVAADHHQIISNISRATLCLITADQEKLPQITSPQHLTPIFRDSIGQTTKVTFRSIKMLPSKI